LARVGRVVPGRVVHRPQVLPALLPTRRSTQQRLPARRPTETNGLVAARYSQCDFGSQILKYLATGDNQGISDLDKNFASYVGTTGPRARAIADASIEQCNKQADDAAAAQAAQASTSASASAQAVQDQKLSAWKSSRAPPSAGNYPAAIQPCALPLSREILVGRQGLIAALHMSASTMARYRRIATPVRNSSSPDASGRPPGPLRGPTTRCPSHCASTPG